MRPDEIYCIFIIIIIIILALLFLMPGFFALSFLIGVYIWQTIKWDSLTSFFYLIMECVIINITQTIL